MNESRVDLAEEFLREAVYRSRASQSVETLLAKPVPADRGNCGLGEKAAVELDLSERGRVLLAQLFGPAGDPDAPRVRERMHAWIEAQDALDRQRNHFLKAFRNAHGFDRTKYSATEIEELEAGLARINAEETSARRSAAEDLLRE
jgi:hypothetical protein